MAEDEETTNTMTPSLPIGRVKKIVKLDEEINKITSEALLLISCSTELFLHFLTERSAEVAAEKKRRIVKVEHLRLAVKRHQTTSNFLFDSLPPPPPPPPPSLLSKSVKDKPAPAKARRIDSFFSRHSENEGSKGKAYSDGGDADCVNVDGGGNADCVDQLQDVAVESASGATESGAAGGGNAHCANGSENGGENGVSI